MSTQPCMKEVPKTPFLRESAKPYRVVVQIGADGAKARLSRDHLTIAKVDVMTSGIYFPSRPSSRLTSSFPSSEVCFPSVGHGGEEMSRPFILSSVRLFLILPHFRSYPCIFAFALASEATS